MRLQVLHVPGCPNAAVRTARLMRLAGDRASEVYLNQSLRRLPFPAHPACAH